MDKRYQVFISSTYADLRDERSKVIQTLMEMDCIPAGMELFPAVDEDQWQFIKKVIDDCDYYLLIVGGRYGSVTPEGISYTEQEYDYAVSQGLKVIALLHGSPDNLPVAKSELAPEKVERLVAFREKVGTGRLVKFWQATAELPGLVALSLGKTIKTYPAVGWVRADSVANVELLAQLNATRKQNDELSAEIARFKAQVAPLTTDLADLGETLEVKGRFSRWNGQQTYYFDWNGSLSWQTAFGLLSPHLLHPTNDAGVDTMLARAIFDHLGRTGDSPTLDDHVFQTIKVQFLAHHLVSLNSYPTTKGSTALFWELTPRGRSQMLAIRAVKRSSEPEGTA